MTDRDPGRHTRRAARQAAQNRPQLAVQLTTLSVEQLHAAMGHLIERKPELAKALMDEAVAENPPRPALPGMMPVDGHRH